MNRVPNPLIEQMARDLLPVRPINFRDGLVLVGLAVLVTILAVELLHGLWRGAWGGQASAFFVITNGLLLILGCAGANSVLRMASPRVGNNHDGPRWAMAMVAVQIGRA
ncbi:MAG: NrsF family protein, partial [Chromatocurvus sp.]